jgi:glycosyltransferase involved in cell wall biosynthesis
MAIVSVIIRTKNEERWIGHCLKMVFEQDYKDIEVILVDNGSTDHTVQIAKRYPLKRVVSIDEFKPGLALNEGIRASSGDYIVCLSAHCVPKGRDWISILLRNFTSDTTLAGVYGRQLPVSFTDPVDKRDLLIVFGQDRQVQIKDYFFHNANSMLRRDVWARFPFDETVSNIEDRVWGKAVISAGYHIVYDPDAAVYHHHGLHQGNTPARAKGVVSIIEKVDADVVNELPESLKPEHTNIAAVIPVQGAMEKGSNLHGLLLDAISMLRKSKYVNNVYLVSSQQDLAPDGVIWVDRKEISNADELGMDELIKMVLSRIECRDDHPQALLYVNYDYCYRPDGIFDELIFDAQYKGYDTVFPGFVDYAHYWFRDADDAFRQTDSSLKSRDARLPVFRALYGLGCLTASALIRKGKMIGGKTGILPVTNMKYTLRARDVGDADISAIFCD